MIEKGFIGLSDLMKWSMVLPSDVNDKIIKAQSLSLKQYNLTVRYLAEKSVLKRFIITLKLLRIENKLKALANGR